MIDLRHVTKLYGGVAVVNDLSMSVERGGFAVLIGPSGCGKSTVLRMINGLIAPDAGEIRVRDRPIGAMEGDALRRGIGYVIQSVGLFPHWSVADNILAVPRLLRWPRARRDARLRALIDLVGLDAALLPRRPAALSGGQQGRVGIARALAADPDIVLMDEPFAALDPVSRANLQDELRRIHRASGKTFVFVTHDMDEALQLATRLVILRAGRVVQVGAPAEILAGPADDFVRTFLGGADMHVRRLDHLRVAGRFDRDIAAAGEAISADATLREALAAMIARGIRRLPVQDGSGRPVGSIGLDALVPDP